VLSLVDDRRFEVYTSALCLAIGNHFAAKKNGKAMARKKIALLADKLNVTSMDESAVTRTMANKRITDLEDGFQYYSAVDAKCTCIVTYDKKDFHFADVEVLDPDQFLLKHVVRR
jgi:predicted nucleic acid-binding protein